MSDATPLPMLRCSAGIAVLGEQVVVHGKNLHRECLKLGFVHYYLFCVTGRSFDERQVRVLEELWIATGYPDARIWCNRIAGYMGSARVDPGLSMSAALAASNSVTYGFRACQAAYNVQAELPENLEARTSWVQRRIEAGGVLEGYGRPIHGHDERIGYALQSLAQAGLQAGPALKRAFWLHTYLQRRKGIEMNIAALWAAICIDFGLTAQQYAELMLLMFTPGYAAVYADQRARPAFSFLAGHQTHPRDSGKPCPAVAQHRAPSRACRRAVPAPDRGHAASRW